jgi:hypothetical protein
MASGHIQNLSFEGYFSGYLRNLGETHNPLNRIAAENGLLVCIYHGEMGYGSTASIF